MPAEWLDLPFAEAVRFLRAKKPTPRDVFDTMSDESKQQAFTASRVAKLEVLQGLLESLQEAAETGKTLAEFTSEWEATGLTDAHLETIFRTNLQSAFGRGRFEQGNDPTIGRAFWGWRYRTVGDERVRPEHQALDGLTFAKGQNEEVFPPWGFNCRCAAEWITNREAKRLGLESDPLPPDVEAALGETDFTSPALGVPVQADLAGYDLGLVRQFLLDQDKTARE